MKIEYLKISTGEDVLAQIASSDNDTFVLKNPMIFAVSREGVGMMPYATHSLLSSP